MSDMTRKEAIKILKKHHMWTGEPSEVVDVRLENKALQMAIDSLETDEAYQLEYEQTTKDDLANCKDADGNSLDDLILEVLQDNFDCGNTYGYKVADAIIELLPSAMPKARPKGHWKKLSVGWGCSECNLSTNDYGKNSYNFCPNCGALMIEEQQGENT